MLAYSPELGTTQPRLVLLYSHQYNTVLHSSLCSSLRCIIIPPCFILSTQIAILQYYDNSASIVGKLDTNEYKEHSYSHRGNAENFSPVGMIRLSNMGGMGDPTPLWTVVLSCQIDFPNNIMKFWIFHGKISIFGIHYATGTLSCLSLC